MGALKLSYYQQEQGVLEKNPFFLDKGLEKKGIAIKKRLSAYRYGFQGQELDNEVKGDNNSVNYKYRMHDPRVGRFFAVDPLSPQYPELTPYQFSSNSPIYLVEVEGLEGMYYKYKKDDDGVWNEFERREDPNYMGKGYEGVGHIFYDDAGMRLEKLDKFIPPVRVVAFQDPIAQKVSEVMGSKDIKLVNGITRTIYDLLAFRPPAEGPWYEGTFMAPGGMEGSTPTLMKIGIKLFPPTALVDAGNTLIMGEDFDGNEVTGAYNRVISPLITLATGGYSAVSGTVAIPKTWNLIDKANSTIGVVQVVVGPMNLQESTVGTSESGTQGTQTTQSNTNVFDKKCVSGSSK